MDKKHANEPEQQGDEERAGFMLDSNIFDKLAAEPACFIRELRRAADAGRSRLFITYIQDAELTAIRNDERREYLRSLLTIIAPERTVAMAIYGLSVYGDPHSTYASDENTAAQTEWTEGNYRQHGKDAVIADTARQRGFILVTEDQSMTARAWASGVDVWNYSRFRENVCGGHGR